MVAVVRKRQTIHRRLLNNYYWARFGADTKYEQMRTSEYTIRYDGIFIICVFLAKQIDELARYNYRVTHSQPHLRNQINRF